MQRYRRAAAREAVSDRGEVSASDNARLCKRQSARSGLHPAGRQIKRFGGVRLWRSASDGVAGYPPWFPYVAVYRYLKTGTDPGRQIMASNSNSATLISAYDELGRVGSSQQTTGSNPAFPFQYAYNLLDGITTESYPVGNCVANSPGQGASTNRPATFTASSRIADSGWGNTDGRGNVAQEPSGQRLMSRW